MVSPNTPQINGGKKKNIKFQVKNIKKYKK